MLSPEQLATAHDQIRALGQEIAGKTSDPDALEHAVMACDRLRLASQVPEWAQERWLTRALDSAIRAGTLEPPWMALVRRIQTLIDCHAGAVA